MASASKNDATKRPWLPFKSELHLNLIPDDLARELAALVIEWGAFEGFIVLDLESMLRLPATKALGQDVPKSFKNKIELWRRAIFAVFPDDDGYKAIATEICSAAKIVARYRHALIHGHWLPPDKPGRPFRLRLGEALDKQPAGSILAVPVELPGAIHRQLREMTDRLLTFRMNRTLHDRRKPRPAGGGPRP